MKISQNGQRDLKRLQDGNNDISELSIRELVRRGLITVDSPQPFSNSPYTGTDVTLTKKGKYWPEEPPKTTLLSDLNDDQRNHLAWRLDHKTGCGLGTASAVARGDHGDLDIVEIFMKYGDRTKRSAQAHARAVEKFKVDPEQREVMDLSLQITSLIVNMVRSKKLTGKQNAELYRQLIESHKTFLRNLEVIDWDKI